LVEESIVLFRLRKTCRLLHSDLLNLLDWSSNSYGRCLVCMRRCWVYDLSVGDLYAAVRKLHCIPDQEGESDERHHDDNSLEHVRAEILVNRSRCWQCSFRQSLERYPETKCPDGKNSMERSVEDYLLLRSGRHQIVDLQDLKDEHAGD